METVYEGLKLMPITSYITLTSILFVIGIIGVLVKRNALVVFMSVELMLNSINLLFAAFSVYHNDAAGQIMVIFIMVVAAAEVAAGLAILVLTYRTNHSIDVHLLNTLKH